MNMTTVQLKGVAAALAAHSDGEVGGVKVHFRMDECGLFQMETVSIPILFSSYSNDVLISH